MTSIGAANGPRGSSLKLCPPAEMLRFSPRSLRLPACAEVAAATERARVRRRRNGCGEVVVPPILRCTESIDAPQCAAIPGAPRRTLTRHRVPSKLRANSLKTNDGRTPKVSQELRPAFLDRVSDFDFEFSGFRVFNFEFRVSTPIPESRAAAIPGFLATSHSSLATLLSGGII